MTLHLPTGANLSADRVADGDLNRQEENRAGPERPSSSRETRCLDEDTIIAYARQSLDASARRVAEAHLSECSHCHELLLLLSEPEMDHLTAEIESEITFQDESSPSDKRIGRYQVQKCVGWGGMGMVYLAFDPQLGREVALKVLRADLWHGSRRHLAEGRLWREAQAMARLSHPNVVTVFDVQGIEDRVVISMEFIRGNNLREWFAGAPRDWETIVEVFVAAGRGLEAAHSRGIVHRDFKPDNVLVSDDGRVVVTDFGLAKWGEQISELETPPAGRPTQHTPVPMTCGLLGTPAYMAPECLAGKSADASSDQYAFCVALHEAAYGCRPGAEGRLDRRIPYRARRALERGLRADPALRHPTMGDLLEDLERPSRRRTWPRIAVVTLACVTLAMAGLWFDEPARCTVTPDWQEAWNPQVHEQLRRIFIDTGSPFAARAWDRVAAAIDDRQTAWRAQYQDNCQATHVRFEQSEARLDLRTQCLIDKRTEAAALIELLADVRAENIADAPIWVNRLSPASECSAPFLSKTVDKESLTSARSARAETVRRNLARAHARLHAGLYREGVRIAEKTSQVAEKYSLRTLQPSALLLVGKLYHALDDKRAVGFFQRAASAALQLGDDRAAARALLGLGRTFIEPLANFEQAGLVLDLADGLASRGSTSPALSAGLLSARASLFKELGQFDAAETQARQAVATAGLRHGDQVNALLEHADVLRLAGRSADSLAASQKALAIQAAELGPDHPVIGNALHQLGIAHYALGQYAEAIDAYGRALSILESALGPDTVAVSSTLRALGIVYDRLGNHPSARSYFKRSLRIEEAERGPNHIVTADALISLGRVHMVLGEYQRCYDLNARALAIKESVLGRTHVNLINALANMASSARKLGRPKEALRFFDRAIRIARDELGEDHTNFAMLLHNRAELFRSIGRWEAARRDYEIAFANFETKFPATHPLLAHPLTGLGELYLLRGDVRALEVLERALRLREAGTQDREELGETRFAVARARHRFGKDGARRVAVQARDDFASLGERYRDRVEDVDAWLNSSVLK